MYHIWSEMPTVSLTLGPPRSQAQPYIMIGLKWTKNCLLFRGLKVQNDELKGRELHWCSCPLEFVTWICKAAHLTLHKVALLPWLCCHNFLSILHAPCQSSCLLDNNMGRWDICALYSASTTIFYLVPRVKNHFSLLPPTDADWYGWKWNSLLGKTLS